MKSTVLDISVLVVFLITYIFTGDISAEEPVLFEDTLLKTAVEDALWITDPTPTDMLGLTQLIRNGVDFRYADDDIMIQEDDLITDLTGLEYALNL